MNPDTFLEDHEQHTLAEHLRRIAKNYPELLRIARRETSPPGGRAARNPNGYGSKPPVNLAAMSTSHELHQVLTEWAANLHETTSAPRPAHTDTQGLAAHLAHHVHTIAGQTWAEDFAEEMRHWSNVVTSQTTAPTGWEGSTLPNRADLLDAAEQTLLSAADVIELHYHVTGEHLNANTLKTWRRAGKLTDHRTSGAPLYSYPEVQHVAAHAPKAKGGRRSSTNQKAC